MRIHGCSLTVSFSPEAQKWRGLRSFTVTYLCSIFIESMFVICSVAVDLYYFITAHDFSQWSYCLWYKAVRCDGLDLVTCLSVWPHLSFLCIWSQIWQAVWWVITYFSQQEFVCLPNVHLWEKFMTVLRLMAPLAANTSSHIFMQKLLF